MKKTIPSLAAAALLFPLYATSVAAQSEPTDYALRINVGGGIGAAMPERGLVPVPFEIEALDLSFDLPAQAKEILINEARVTYGQAQYESCMVMGIEDCIITIGCENTEFTLESGDPSVPGDLGLLNGKPVIGGMILTKCLSLPKQGSGVRER